MTTPWTRDRATFFYLGFGLLGLTVIAFGFGVTYVAPMVRRSFSAPWFVHLHGAAATAWVLIFIAQALLIRRRGVAIHRRLGRVAIPLATVVWASGIVTAVWAAARDLPVQGTAATSALAGTATGLTLYQLLVVAAVAARKRTDWHKRLVMLGTIQLLWPAFFRLRHWFPAVPDPDIWFALVLAYSPILVAALRDWRRYGRIHPVWLLVAPALVIEQSVEFVFFDQAFHRHLGQWLYSCLGG